MKIEGNENEQRQPPNNPAPPLVKQTSNIPSKKIKKVISPLIRREIFCILGKTNITNPKKKLITIHIPFQYDSPVGESPCSVS
jgi:hypothetical protein